MKLTLFRFIRREYECCVVRMTVKEADQLEKIRWYRVYCVEICSDGFATMQFIDYGNIKPIEILDIRPIPESLLFDYITVTPDCFSDGKKFEQFITLTFHNISHGMFSFFFFGSNIQDI